MVEIAYVAWSPHYLACMSERCERRYLGPVRDRWLKNLLFALGCAHTRLRQRTFDAMAGAASKGQTKQGRQSKEKCDNSDDTIWDRKHRHRHAGLASAHRSPDVIQMYVLISTEELPPEEEPMPPDPYDRKLSKRQWELSTEKDLSIIEGL